MLTRCAIFSWASNSTVKASSQFGLCLFRAGSGLGWFVCSLNSFLCVGLLLCSPLPTPFLKLRAFFLKWGPVGGKGRTWQMRKAVWWNGEWTCCCSYTPIFHTIQHNQPLSCPHSQTAVSDGPTATLKVWNCNGEGVFSMPSCILPMRWRMATVVLMRKLMLKLTSTHG